MYWLYLYQHITSVLGDCLIRTFDRQQRRDKSNMSWQTWVGAMLTMLLSCWSELNWLQHCALLCCILLRLFVLSRVTHYLDFCSIIFQKNSLHLGLKRRKAKWEPSVRCYKLRARPVARPREPDLAAPRLRRVKRCTQRSSLHLYAPYIGRLLLQPTGTWLLAS